MSWAGDLSDSDPNIRRNRIRIQLCSYNCISPKYNKQRAGPNPTLRLTGSRSDLSVKAGFGSKLSKNPDLKKKYPIRPGFAILPLLIH